MFRNPLRADVAQEPDFFQKPLRHSRVFRNALIETAFVVGFGVLILATYWQDLAMLPLFFAVVALLVVASTVLVTFKNHKKLSETLRDGAPEEVKRESLSLAAAQAERGPMAVRTVALFFLMALFYALSRLDGGTWFGRLRDYLQNR